MNLHFYIYSHAFSGLKLFGKFLILLGLTLQICEGGAQCRANNHPPVPKRTLWDPHSLPRNDTVFPSGGWKQARFLTLSECQDLLPFIFLSCSCVLSNFPHIMCLSGFRGTCSRDACCPPASSVRLSFHYSVFQTSVKIVSRAGAEMQCQSLDILSRQ